MSYYTEARRTLMSMHLQVKTSLERCTEFFFILTIIYSTSGGENISRARATQLYFMRTTAVAAAARAMLLARRGVPNEWCLRVRVFYHLDFFLKRPPFLYTSRDELVLGCGIGYCFFFSDSKKTTITCRYARARAHYTRRTPKSGK